MRIVTNEKLVRRNKQFAQYLFFASFGLLGLGLFVSGRQVAPQSDADVALGLLIPPLVLVLAYTATFISVRMTNLWVRKPRPEEALRESLKGINPKSVLYSYYHFPARHVLICPQGVFAIVTRYQDGRISVRGERWQTRRSFAGKLAALFRFDSIGNPNVDALRAAQHVESILKPIAGDVEVKPLILFIDPRVELTVEEPVVPVCHTSPKHPLNIKDYLWKLGKPQGMPLVQEQIDSFEEKSIGS